MLTSRSFLLCLLFALSLAPLMVSIKGKAMAGTGRAAGQQAPIVVAEQYPGCDASTPYCICRWYPFLPECQLKRHLDKIRSAALELLSA